MSALRSEDPNWSHGNSAADVGSKEWADFVRLQLVSMVDHLGENEESFLGYVEIMREHRAWTLMARKDGSTFKTIEEFCSERRPWGLGTTWAKLRPHLVSGMAKRGKSQDEIERALALEAVPEAEQGKRVDLTSNPRGEKLAPGHVQRLRAITRAPDAVKDAYREGRVSQAVAAKLGPKNPTPEQAARVAEAAQEVRKAKTRKEADAAALRVLGVKKPTIVETAFRLVERMTPAERIDFDRQIRPLIQAAEGG